MVASFSELMGKHKKLCPGKLSEEPVEPPTPIPAAVSSSAKPICKECGAVVASFSELMGKHKSVCPSKATSNTGMQHIKLKSVAGERAVSSENPQLGRVIRGPSCPDCGEEVRSVDDIDASHQAVCKRPDIGAARRQKAQEAKEAEMERLRLEQESSERERKQRLIDYEKERLWEEKKRQLQHDEEQARAVASRRLEADRARCRQKALAEYAAEDAEDERLGLPRKKCRWCNGKNQIRCDYCSSSSVFCKRCKGKGFWLCDFCEDGLRIWGWYEPWTRVTFPSEHDEQYYLEQVRKEIREQRLADGTKL